MNKLFFKTIFVSMGIIFSSAFALEVYQPELEGTESEPVVFENYTGPHAQIDSLSSITGIGTNLGKALTNPAESQNIATSERYSVIHAVDSTTGKLDADIFIINSNATVDHITNLRRIIASYLTAAYGYSEENARTLSVFITVYNAVYRGKMDFFTEKYKNVVIDNLSANKAGLALSYTQWPGNTQILIPLAEPTSGGLSTIDTSAISDKQVVESLREESDKGLEERKNLVDIKEQEAQDATAKAQEAQKNVTEEQKLLKAEQEKLPELISEAENAQKEAAADPENEELQQKANDAAQQVTNTEQKIEEHKQNIADSATESTKQQQKSDVKANEAYSERTDIAKDQQQLVNEQKQNENATIVYALRLENDTKLLSSLVKVNAKTGSIIEQSSVTVIRNRNIYSCNEGFIAIAGENTGKGAIKLVILDLNSLEIILESSEFVSEDSVLVQSNDFYYCIIVENKNNYLAKFDSSLMLIAKSEITVKSSTPITVTDNAIVVTSTTGKLTLLSTDTLKSITK